MLSQLQVIKCASPGNRVSLGSSNLRLRLKLAESGGGPDAASRHQSEEGAPCRVCGYAFTANESIMILLFIVQVAAGGSADG